MMQTGSAGRRLALECTQVRTPRKVSADMRNLDVVVSDLEWQRLRRRVASNPAEALFFNCGTWALIAVLKLVAR
jgi:hypothetical protein